jgi:hypothetical protein
MRIRVLRSLGKNLPPYREGQVVDTDEATAEPLLAAGLAEVVSDKKKPAAKPAEEPPAAGTPAPPSPLSPPGPPSPPSGAGSKGK